tara:strand:- start:3502 stop:3705 length:204 start_codon:yes stop_codon:yes gene_type:complete
MPSPEQKRDEIQSRYDTNFATYNGKQQQINTLQAEIRKLEPLLIEDNGALKVLNELLASEEDDTQDS